MEIWVLSLTLCMLDDCYNYELFLRSRKLDGTFKDYGTDYVQTDASKWSRKVIPKDMEIKKTSGQYMVVKGFEHKPTGEEIKEIKREMKDMLNEYIEEERDRFLYDVEQKLMCLVNE